jgi:hypothetical protein
VWHSEAAQPRHQGHLSMADTRYRDGQPLLFLRIPGTHRYQVTEFGLRIALFFTRLHNRFIRPGLAQICAHDPPAPSRLRPAFTALEAEMDRLAAGSHLAAGSYLAA